MNTNTNRDFGFWIVVDFVVVLAAYSIAFFSRTLTAALSYSEQFPAIVVVTTLTLVMLYLFGVYRHIWARTSGHEVSVIVYAHVVTTLIATFLDVLITPRPLPLSVILVGGMLAMGTVVALRYRSRLISGGIWRWNAIWRGEFPQEITRLLIIGAGESGQEIAWRLKHRFPGNAYHIIGFIDDNPRKQGMIVEGCEVLGTREDIVSLAKAREVDLIVVAIHNIAGADFRDILTICEQSQARIKVVPDVFDLMSTNHNNVPLRDIQPEDLLGRSIVERHKDVDMSSVTGKVILVTGAAGSIGSELSRQILNYEPVKVVLLDNNESGLHDLVLELMGLAPDLEFAPALVDIASSESLRAVFKKYRPQIVFHAAAYKHVPMLEYYPQEALRVNIRGTLNLAEMALQYDVERCVLVSTDKAVNPSSVMGASKRIGELMLHALAGEPDCNTIFAAVRFGNVLGSRGSVIPTFNRQIDHGGPVTVTHRDMTRYFMSIPEAANLIIHAACLTQGDEIFVLKMGEVVSILDLAERMIRLRGLRPHKDIPIEFSGIRPGEKMHEELFYGSEKPLETIHPSIVKLNTWSDDFESEYFFRQLMQLLARDNITDIDILTQLQQIIDLNKEVRVHLTNGKASVANTA